MIDLFGLKRIRELEKTVGELVESRNELRNKLTLAAQPFRVGERNPFGDWWGKDTRPKVELRDAINFIREHLKLEFVAVPEVPGRIELVKKPPEKKT